MSENPFSTPAESALRSASTSVLEVAAKISAELDLGQRYFNVPAALAESVAVLARQKDWLVTLSESQDPSLQALVFCSVNELLPAKVDFESAQAANEVGSAVRELGVEMRKGARRFNFPAPVASEIKRSLQSRGWVVESLEPCSDGQLEVVRIS